MPPPAAVVFAAGKAPKAPPAGMFKNSSRRVASKARAKSKVQQKHKASSRGREWGVCSKKHVSVLVCHATIEKPGRGGQAGRPFPEKEEKETEQRR